MALPTKKKYAKMTERRPDERVKRCRSVIFLFLRCLAIHTPQSSSLIHLGLEYGREKFRFREANT